MALGELVAQLLGWLGELIQWVISLCPRYKIVRYRQAAVFYPAGEEPIARHRGVWWYWPVRTEVALHTAASYVMRIPAVTVETKDAVTITLGAAARCRISDVLAFDVENFNADDNAAEAAQGCLCDIAKEFTLEELRRPADEDSRFGGMLARRLGVALKPFGISVETCRPNDFARTPTVVRLFGAGPLDPSTRDVL